MPPYANLSGRSGVVAYETDSDAIAVAFVDGWLYVYTVESAGRARVERMKALAARGRGLSGYIARHIRDAYAAKRRWSGAARP